MYTEWSIKSIYDLFQDHSESPESFTDGSSAYGNDDDDDDDENDDDNDDGDNNNQVSRQHVPFLNLILVFTYLNVFFWFHACTNICD